MVQNEFSSLLMTLLLISLLGEIKDVSTLWMLFGLRCHVRNYVSQCPPIIQWRNCSLYYGCNIKCMRESSMWWAMWSSMTFFGTLCTHVSVTQKAKDKAVHTPSQMSDSQVMSEKWLFTHIRTPEDTHHHLQWTCLSVQVAVDHHHLLYCYKKHCTITTTVSMKLHVLCMPPPTANKFPPVWHLSLTKMKS
jgi:hypothetical protein